MANTRDVYEEQTFHGPQAFAQGLTTQATATTGLPGATVATRYAGGTTGGAPASGTFAAGDLVIDTAGAAWLCASGGSPGTWVALTPDLSLYREPMVAGAGKPPIAVTARRGSGTGTVSPSTGVAVFCCVPLLAGQVISNLSVLALGGESGGSHAWMALLDTGAVVRAVSADNAGATFFAANTAKTLAMGPAYIVPSTGLYVAVLGCTATGMPTFVGGPALSAGEAGWGSGLPYCGTAGSIAGPPGVGATLTLSANAPDNIKVVLT